MGHSIGLGDSVFFGYGIFQKCFMNGKGEIFSINLISFVRGGVQLQNDTKFLNIGMKLML